MNTSKLSIFTVVLITSFQPIYGQETNTGDFGFGLADSSSDDESTSRNGIEALTTWRSEYVYRGFALASNSMEFQLASQILLGEESKLDLGLFYGTATSGGDYSEVVGFLDYSKTSSTNEKLKYMAKLTLHDNQNSIFESGVEVGLGFNYMINEAFDVSSLISYDTGASGVYFETKLSYFEQINDDSYVVLEAGLSLADDYYKRSGLNHAYSQLTYTYNVNESVSVSPYLAVNLGIHEDAKNHFFGGVYFAVSF